VEQTAGKRVFGRAAVIYLAALGVIAALAVATHLVADAMVSRQTDTAHIVNISGRQRMLSQRIAGLAQHLALAAPERRPAVESALSDAVKRMESTHRTLTEGVMKPGGAMAASAAVRAIFLEPPHDLDAQVRRYVAAAQRFLLLPPGQRADSAELAALQEEAFESILAALDAHVQQWQDDSERAVADLRAMLAVLLTVMLLTLAAEALFIFRPLFRRLAAAQAALLAAASTDPLTGCLNRRSLLEAAGREFDRVRRYGGGAAVAVIDIDHFKSINDTHGHAAGDEAIRALTATVVETIRSTDIFGRSGGEEFVLILPETPLGDAQRVLEKLRARVADMTVATGGATLSMTVSIGYATVSGYDADVFDTLNRADQALYQAKGQGRNRVVGVMSAGPAPAPAPV